MLLVLVMVMLTAVPAAASPLEGGSGGTTRRAAKKAVDSAAKAADQTVLESGAADLAIAGGQCKVRLDNALYVGDNPGEDCLDSATELAYCQRVVKIGATRIAPDPRGGITSRSYDTVAFTFCVEVAKLVQKNGVTESTP